MLVARVAPPLPDVELPQQVVFGAPSGQQVVELVVPTGGLLVRRLVADLTGLGYKVAWIRPMPFEVDSGSIAPLLLMALSTAPQASSGEDKPVVIVVESPTAMQAEAVLNQLLVPGVPEPFGPSVVLVVDSRQSHRTRPAEMPRVRVEVPALPGHRLRRLITEQACGKVPIRRLSVAAGGLPGLIDSLLRSAARIGIAELSRIVTEVREPNALTRGVVHRLLDGASAGELAALEMAGHLGYAHARFGSLEAAVAESAHPWWVPLTDGWWQVDPAWRPSLLAYTTDATRAIRSACLSRLVAELVEAGAVHEAIELCINAGWPGLAADLLAGEADTLLASGRYVTLTSWLERLPPVEARSHPSLAQAAADLIPAELSTAGWPSPAENHTDDGPAVPIAVPQRKRRIFRWSSPSSVTQRTADPAASGGAFPPAASGGAFPPAASGGAFPLAEPVAVPQGGPDSILSPMTGAASPAAATGQKAPSSPAVPPVPANRSVVLIERDGTPIGPATHGASRQRSEHRATGDEDPGIPLRVEARLFGQFELLVRGRPIQRWRGNRGRILLAFLLLHRSRPLTRDELGGVFWPDAAAGVVRNRLHVALYGLRKDLRALTDHPIVVHGQRGFSIHAGIDLWLDTEEFDKALAAARRQSPGRSEGALARYETAIELYRGELLADAPFEEWALLHRERLRLQHLEALGQVARLRFAAGRYADCLDACQRLIPGDLCREEIHRLMMRCYTRLNQPHLAVRQYHQCERQLRDELGIEPTDPTRQLYERIRRRELI